MQLISIFIVCSEFLELGLFRVMPQFVLLDSIQRNKQDLQLLGYSSLLSVVLEIEMLARDLNSWITRQNEHSKLRDSPLLYALLSTI